MRRKSLTIFLIMITFFLPFTLIALFRNGTNNIQIPNFRNDLKQPDLKSKVFNEINKNNASGTRNYLNINQTVESNMTNLNWLAQNEVGNSSNTPVGNISRNFNITGINNYNRTQRSIIIQNVSAEPTWSDIECNTSGVYRILNNVVEYCLAMEFNLSVDSRVTSAAWNGRVILGSSPSWSAEIWNRTSQWQGDPSFILKSLVFASGIGYGWHNYTFNLNLTQGSYFFVINGSQLSQPSGDQVEWDRMLDATDGNEGDVYNELGGWNPLNIDLSLKIQTVPIDSSNNSLKNLDPESIDMNMTIDSTNYNVYSNGTYIFQNLNEIGNKTVTIAANSSFSANITWQTQNFNATYTTNIYYNTTTLYQYIHWNFNFTITQPTPNYSETFSNYSVSIFKPNPSWDMIKALNSTNQNVTEGILEDNGMINLSNNSAPILTNGEWKFACQNDIQSILYTINQSIIATIYHPKAYVHSENIQINASITGFSGGFMNITIFNSTDNIVTSQWTTINSTFLNDFILFNLTVPIITSTGNYTIRLLWSNETYVAANNTYILVVNSTNLRVINENEVNGNQFLGEDINLTVYYNDTHSNAPITNANVTFQLFNESAGHTLVHQDNLTESLGPGYYNYTLLTNDLVNGTYQIQINASKDWYNNATQNRTFDLVYNASLERILPINVITSNYNPFNLTIKMRYFEWSTNINLSDAIVTYNTNMTGENGNLDWNSSDETYCIQLNYSDYTLDRIYEINISASKLGFQTRNQTIYWNVSDDDINPTVIIDSPVNNYNTSLSWVMVNWASSYDSESGIKIFQVFRNGSSQYIGLLTSQNITTLSEGWNNITIVAQDYAENNGSSMIWVIMDSELPSITITNPAINGQNVTGSIISISGFANGTGTQIASVGINNSNFYIFQNPATSYSGNYEFRNSSIIGDGYIAIEVNVTDYSGLTSSATCWFYVDNTPPQLPSPPSNIQYEFGSTGNKITWTWQDWDPDKYNITWIEGTTVNQTGTYYNDTPIEFNVDGLEIGLYTFKIGVNDTSGNSATHSVTVRVVDTTPPNLLYATPNINYEFESTGYNITWRWNETHPAKYNITWVAGGTVNQTGALSNGSDIVFNVDGLNVGSYAFRIGVNDTSANSASNDVTVTVSKFPSTKVDLNVTGIYNMMWGEFFYVNVSFQRTNNSLITELGHAGSNWSKPGLDQYISFSNGNYIFNVSLNATTNGPFTRAGLWGLNFSAYSDNYARAWANFTVNITTLTHLNATDQSGKDYNNTNTFKDENATLSIYYKDTIFNDPLGDLTNYIIGTNWTNGWWNVSKTGGYYDIILNTTGMNIGNYSVILNASRVNYEFKEIICNVTINPKFNVTITILSTIELNYKPGDVINITIQITNESDGLPVPNNNVQFLINTTLIDTKLTNGSGIATFLYTVTGNDANRVLNISINYLGAFGFNSNITFTTTSIASGAGFDPLIFVGLGIIFGPKGLDPIYLFIIIGAVAVGAVAIAASVGARRRKARVEIEKKKTISSVTDVANIRHILAIHKGTGIDVFNYEVEKGLDMTLVSGFIQAVKEFGKELSRKATEKKKPE